MGFGSLLVKYGLVEETPQRDFEVDASEPAPPAHPGEDPFDSSAPAAPPAAAPPAAFDVDLEGSAHGEIDETLLAELESAIGQVETDAFDYTDYVQLRERLEEKDVGSSPERIARTVSVFAEAQGATVDDVIASAEAARSAVEDAGAHAIETAEADRAKAGSAAEAEHARLLQTIESSERTIEEARARIVTARKRLVDLDDEGADRTIAYEAKTSSIARTVQETLAEIDADIHTLQAVR